MVRWPQVILSGDLPDRLDVLQASVDGEPNYRARVVRAKSAWKSKNPALFNRIRDVLSTMCSGARRCAYCEDSAADEIEHIYPKDLYPERVFRWLNYVFACGPCNGPKNAKFAVLADGELVSVTRARGMPVEPPAEGDAALLNPRLEEPMEFLSVDLETFMVLPRPALNGAARVRAEYTIELLTLNRDYLLRARAEAFENYHARVHQYVSYKREGTPNDALALLSQRLGEMAHPAVWHEIKRTGPLQSASLRSLLAEAPELVA
jgi:uncharacterized protein (TIGR02646 family)